MNELMKKREELKKELQAKLEVKEVNSSSAAEEEEENDEEVKD